MSDVLDRRVRVSSARKTQHDRHDSSLESLESAIRTERMQWDSDDDVIVVNPPQGNRHPSDEIDFAELSSWTATGSARIRRAAEMALAQRQQSPSEFFYVHEVAKRHLAVRATQPHQVQYRGDYYVSRAYRSLWAILLILGTAWGFVSGIAIATSSLLSPSAVLMGIFAVIVLAATLFVAGSRDRIRRRKQ